MTRQTYFEHPVLERDLGDDFLQLVVLAAQILDFVAGGFANRVASKLFLPGFEKVLASSVGQAGGEPFSAAQVCNALRASKRFEPASSRGSRGLASAAARRSTFPYRAPSSRKHVGSNEMRRGELEPSPRHRRSALSSVTRNARSSAHPRAPRSQSGRWFSDLIEDPPATAEPSKFFEL